MNCLDYSTRELQGVNLSVAQSREWATRLSEPARQLRDPEPVYAAAARGELNSLNKQSYALVRMYLRHQLRRGLRRPLSLRKLDRLAEQARHTEWIPRIVRPTPIWHELPNFPGAPELLVPPGWLLRESGLYRHSMERIGWEQLRQVLPMPILISKRLPDRREYITHLLLSWGQDGRWRNCLMRDRHLHACHLPRLSQLGVPVTDENAGALEKFLRTFLALNRSRMPLLREEDLQ